jgi:dihydroxyacid dehydratase/phosphogluconate dehydratase
MKQEFELGPDEGEGAAGLREVMEALGSRTMVQVVILTAGGQKYALIGPVIQDPEARDGGFNEVTAIEFGDLIPMEVAARMLSGEHKRWLGAALQ